MEGAVMSSKATVPNRVYLLSRVNKVTGYTQTVNYVGSLRLKPKGWKVVKQLGR